MLNDSFREASSKKGGRQRAEKSRSEEETPWGINKRGNRRRSDLSGFPFSLCSSELVIFFFSSLSRNPTAVVVHGGSI